MSRFVTSSTWRAGSANRLGQVARAGTEGLDLGVGWLKHELRSCGWNSSQNRPPGQQKGVLVAQHTGFLAISSSLNCQGQDGREKKRQPDFEEP